MSFNLCDLPPAKKALIEVDKAAYAMWKEHCFVKLDLQINVHIFDIFQPSLKKIILNIKLGG